MRPNKQPSETAARLTDLDHAAIQLLCRLVFALFHHDLQRTSVMLPNERVPQRQHEHLLSVITKQNWNQFL